MKDNRARMEPGNGFLFCAKNKTKTALGRLVDGEKLVCCPYIFGI